MTQERTWTWKSGQQSILTFIVLLCVECQASSSPCVSFPICKITQIKLTWNPPSIPNPTGDEVHVNKLLSVWEGRCCVNLKYFYYSVSRRKGCTGFLLAQHLSVGWGLPKLLSTHVREYRRKGGIRGRCNREGTMLQQLVNMSLGCSCGNQEQRQEAGDMGGREEGGRKKKEKWKRWRSPCQDHIHPCHEESSIKPRPGL